ncbi:tetratricopeptide repeat protein [Candidatus Fermentibacteria bacterium]|nr:tetratricopeptide repeat protein [Candidatus Fermentibacteria bacterium]
MRNLIPSFVAENFARNVKAGTLDAATLSVDISGFTPLTETLLCHEKDGAEVLAEVLDAVFAPLVHTVHRYGGIIPLFAGDAFCAIFPFEESRAGLAGHEAAHRAATAALLIQENLRGDGKTRVFATRHGEFPIGVKVGLSAGAISWGIVPYRDLNAFYFRGPGLTASRRVEHAASSGEIRADQRILTLLGTMAMTSHDGARFALLARCLQQAVPLTDEPPSIPRQILSPMVPAELLNGEVETEFRHVCPIFILFREPSDRNALHEFVATVGTLTNRYGGYFAQIEFGLRWGVALVLFGAPIGFEDSLERAALLLADLHTHTPTPQWRAALSTGITWAGFRGGAERCEYGVFGDVVNVAARIAAKASWSRVWITSEAAGALRERHRVARVGPRTLKGKGAPLEIFRLEHSGSPPPPKVHQPTLVGRDEELERLLSLIGPVLEDGQAAVVDIRGEPGIGKTHLVNELRRRVAHGWTVNWFTCPADQVLRLPLNPFRYFLRDYFQLPDHQENSASKATFTRIMEDLCANLADPTLGEQLRRAESFLGSLVDLHWDGSLFEQLPPQLRFENVCEAFRAFIRAESTRRPVVLVLEDAHWLDEQSLALLRALTRHPRGMALAIVYTSRSVGESASSHLPHDPAVPYELLELRPLERQYVAAMASQVFEGPVDDTTVTLLTDRSAGNPFFLEQLLLHTRERGHMTWADGMWKMRGQDEVPAKVDRVVTARLDRLSRGARHMVQRASVLGREFSLEVLALLDGFGGGMRRALAEAEAAGILVGLDEHRGAFRHALLRDAAYDMQLRRRLKTLHLRAAEAILSVYRQDLAPHYPDLVHHYHIADDTAQERYFAWRAGEQASTRHARDDAIRYFTRTLELTPDSDLRQQFDVLAAREAEFDIKGERGSQRRDLEEMDRLAGRLGDARLQAQVSLRNASYGEAVADFGSSVKAAQLGADIGEVTGDAALRAEGYLRWGTALCRKGDEPSARVQLEKALALAREQSLMKIQAETLRVLGLVAFQNARYDEAESYYEASLCLARAPDARNRVSEGSTVLNLGNVALYQTQYPKAVERYREAQTIFSEIGHRLGQANALNNLGLVSKQSGAHEEAEDYYTQAVAVYRDIGNLQGEALAVGNLGNIALYRGGYEDALHYYQEALRIRQAIGDQSGVDMALTNMGIVQIALGRYAEAEDTLRHALHVCKSCGDRRVEGWALAYRSLLHRHTGNIESAAQGARDALARGQELRDGGIEAMALTFLGFALAESGALDDAMEVLHRAVGKFTELNRMTGALEPMAAIARVKVAQGQIDAAVESVEEILRLLSSGTMNGATEPFWVYDTCVQVLEAARDPRGEEVLEEGCRHLCERAELIQNAEWRNSFLNEVAWHRSLLSAHDAAERLER